MPIHFQILHFPFFNINSQFPKLTHLNHEDSSTVSFWNIGTHLSDNKVSYDLIRKILRIYLELQVTMLPGFY